MRRLSHLLASLTLVAAAVATPALAQAPAEPAPNTSTQPPAMVPLDDSVQPQVTIKKREGSTVEEHRINGKLYEIKITPENGIPYTLIDQSGDGTFVRMDSSPGTPHLSVPMWVIGTF